MTDYAEIFTDGSNAQCSEYKHMGSAAIVLLYRDRSLASINHDMKMPSKIIVTGRYVGLGSNNVAELTAVQIGLVEAGARGIIDVHVYSDSTYCCGLLYPVRRGDGFWSETVWEYRASANQYLVADIRRLIEVGFSEYAISHVKGHSVNKWNNLADRVAGWCKDNRTNFDITALCEVSRKMPWLMSHRVELGLIQ